MNMHTPIIIQTETNPFRAVYAYVRPAIGNIWVMYYIITLIQLYIWWYIYVCLPNILQPTYFSTKKVLSQFNKNIIYAKSCNIKAWRYFECIYIYYIQAAFWSRVLIYDFMDSSYVGKSPFKLLKIINHSTFYFMLCVYIYLYTMDSRANT